MISFTYTVFVSQKWTPIILSGLQYTKPYGKFPGIISQTKMDGFEKHPNWVGGPNWTWKPIPILFWTVIYQTIRINLDFYWKKDV